MDAVNTAGGRAPSRHLAVITSTSCNPCAVLLVVILAEGEVAEQVILAHSIGAYPGGCRCTAVYMYLAVASEDYGKELPNTVGAPLGSFSIVVTYHE